MKFKIKPTTCQNCNKNYDSALEKCPYCGEPNRDINLDHFNHQIVWLDIPRQIILFLSVFLGLQVVSLILGFAVGGIMISTGKYENMNQALSSIEGQNYVNTFTYLVLALIIVAIVFPARKSIAQSFKSLKNYGFGIILGFILIGVSVLYGLLTNPFISEHFGETVNQNQKILEAMIKQFPVTSVLILGLIGPIVEEFGYRVGLFNFLMRFNRYIAYIVAAIVFAFIHFNFYAEGKDGYLLELIIIPNYIFAGLILCFTYDKFGLCGSICAHCVNNLFSVFSNIIVNSLS